MFYVWKLFVNLDNHTKWLFLQELEKKDDVKSDEEKEEKKTTEEGEEEEIGEELEEEELEEVNPPPDSP